MTDYCGASDLYDHGLPRGAVPNPGRDVDSTDLTANTFSLDVHGFSTDDLVSFRADGGGTLPTGIAAGTTYYAIPVTQNTFQVAASAGGAAIDLTGTASRVIAIAQLPVAAAITWASQVIDQAMPSHAVPLVAPFPEIIRMTAAELAAGKLARRTGTASESLLSIVDAAKARLKTWNAGVPIRGTDAPATHTNLAATASAPRNDARGWDEFGRF